MRISMRSAPIHTVELIMYLEGEGHASESLEAQVRHRPRIAIIDLEGEIDSFAEDVLNASYAEAESRDANVILINFSKVDYINSTGIAPIVELAGTGTQNRNVACWPMA